jgi:transcriptional regulator with XRE-family HTH domain
MESPIAPKLAFVLKALSMSRGQLASELGVDKSAVGRWISGAAAPSPHNLAQLTARVRARVDGFTTLDWERDLDGLATVIGVAAPGAPAAGVPSGLRLPLLDESLATTRLRGGAYEGFYRITRPYAQQPGEFVHDQVMLRRETNGFMALQMFAGGTSVEGWVMLMNNQLFVTAAELTSGAFVFAIVNGVSTLEAGLLDGLILYCALDPSRTPTATAAIFERVGRLTGDRDADDARFAVMKTQPALAPADSVPPAIQAHLVRNIGEGELARGGDWLLRMPLSRSMSRGLIERLED